MSDLRPTTFNRPPRTRILPEAITVRTPEPPSLQRRGLQSLTPLLSSVSLIIASAVVANIAGRSLIYLIPMVAASGVFMIIAVMQMVRGALQARKDKVRYRQDMDAATAMLISAHAEQQYTRCRNDPPPTPGAARYLLHCLQAAQQQQIANLLRPLTQRNTPAEEVYPAHLRRFPIADDPATMLPSVLDIAGCAASRPGCAPLPRLWERRPSDPDFLTIRFGQGEAPSATIIQQPHARDLPSEHTQLEALFRTLPDVPIVCGLPTVGSLGIAGSAEQRLALAHALIWHIVAHHTPTDVRIAAVYNRSSAWSWMKWLPHTVPLNGDRTRRMLAATPRQHEQLLVNLLNELSQRREVTDIEVQPPALVLVIHTEEAFYREPAVRDLLRLGKAHRIYVLVVAEEWQRLPADCGAMIRFVNDTFGHYAPAAQAWSQPILLDQADPEQSELLARTLAPLGASNILGDQEIPQTVRLLDLFTPSFNEKLDCLEWWNNASVRAWHQNVPIGQEAGGQTRYLDLNEHCDGPHGIIAGKTGAGKSELLQAVIAAIALTHAPDRAQFFLIDFKGGASLRMFSALPHTVGFVTDLQDSRLAERAIIALKRELRRRKDILNDADVKDITAYRALLNPPAPLANLLVIIDEFDAMVTNQPTFVAELVSVVKQGRSLGVHLLLATQQPSLAVKDEIKTQLQYWIALRLGSSQDSRDMLQRPDAAFLPGNIPGRAYMRVGTALTLFQAARVSAPYQPSGNEAGTTIFEIDETGQIVPLDTLPSTHVGQTSSPDQAGLTDLDIIVGHLKDAGHCYSYTSTAIWCPPLAAALPLSSVLDSAVVQNWQQLHVAPDRFEWPRAVPGAQRMLPFGMIDLPEEGVQLPTAINLSQGHALIVGAPGSGKTVLLRTILTSMALMYRPDEVWCYVIDAGGPGLRVLNGLPHVGGIVGVREVEGIRRLLWMLLQELKQRSAPSADQRIENGTDTAHPAVVLIIDKFFLFRQEYEPFNLIDDLIMLASQGRAYNMHLIITADRPGDVPFRLQGLIDIRITLRVADDNDSLTLMGRRDAAAVPAQQPGRGYRMTQEHGWAEIQVALPYMSTEESMSNVLAADLAAETRALVRHLQLAWTNDPASQQQGPPPIQLLPTHIHLDEMLDQATLFPAPRDQRARLAVIGIEGQSLGAATVTLGPRCPTLLVAGGPRAGKTSMLHTIIRSLARRYAPNRVRFALIDPRGSSFAEIQLGSHEPLYASAETELIALTQYLNEAFTTSPSATHWIIVIDDFDLGTTLLASQFSKPYSTTATRTFFQLLEWLVSKGREHSCSLIVATQSTTPTGLLAALNAGRNGFIIRPHEYPPATNLLGIKLPVPLVGQTISGRALQVTDGVQRWVQVADAGLGADESVS